ncbi:MAG: DUF2933 domain-containing protein [Chloroflexi bacterium]|nr:DUF2933 domain-containing protein [Chloroflexota bacterium]
MESLIGLLPFGLLALVCPLAMLFMMRGMMGGHGKHESHARADAEPDGPMATRVAAMEQEIKRLRGELDADSNVQTGARAGSGGRR